MMLPYDHTVLVAQLAKLDQRGQLAFGALCAERLLPNYAVFSKEAGWGDVALLRRALDTVWAVLDGVSLDHATATALSAAVELAAPHTEDFDTLFSTSAQDACFAVCALYDFVLAPEPAHIADVARYATDSIDLYVQEREQMPAIGAHNEYLITTHPLMQDELRRQADDVAALATVGQSRQAQLLQLRRKALDDRGNLGLS